MYNNVDRYCTYTAVLLYIYTVADRFVFFFYSPFNCSVIIPNLRRETITGARCRRAADKRQPSCLVVVVVWPFAARDRDVSAAAVTDANFNTAIWRVVVVVVVVIIVIIVIIRAQVTAYHVDRQIGIKANGSSTRWSRMLWVPLSLGYSLGIPPPNNRFLSVNVHSLISSF